MSRKPLLLLLVAALLVAAAFAVPALAATKSIAVGDDYFVKDGSAPTVTVKSGTTLKFVWKGKSPHNAVVEKGPKKFRSGTKTSGSYSVKVFTKGTYTIVCTIHAPDMKLKLKVVK